jgi:hypothetical protein
MWLLQALLHILLNVTASGLLQTAAVDAWRVCRSLRSICALLRTTLHGAGQVKGTQQQQSQGMRLSF